MATTFATPAPDVLAAVGVVAIRHGQLDYILRMTIKSISGIGLQPSLDATANMMSQQLRSRILRMARRKLGEASDDYLRIEALMARAQRAAHRRNSLLHALWIVNTEDGSEAISDREQGWRVAPTPEELLQLSQDMQDLTVELNHARLHGFLKEALERAA